MNRWRNAGDRKHKTTSVYDRPVVYLDRMGIDGALKLLRKKGGLKKVWADRIRFYTEENG